MYILSFNPIDIDARLYDLIARKYNQTIINYYFNGSMPKERVQCGYEIALSHFKRQWMSEQEAIHYFENLNNEIIIFFGIINPPINKTILLRLQGSNNSMFIISERYNAFGNFLEKRCKELVRFIQFRKIAHQTKEELRGFFAYGEKGVKYFRRCGFRKLHPLIYATNYKDMDFSSNNGREESSCIRMVYAGRLEFDLKGVDILLKAIERLVKTNVGGVAFRFYRRIWCGCRQSKKVVV